MKLNNRQRRSASVACLAFALSASAGRGGQVVTDGSLGAATSLTGPNFSVTAGLGRQVGPNLFHSFSQLNLSAGEVATFSGPTSVGDVLARVTGGASSIDGTLRCTIPNANFFLINPSGVVFGPNSALDVRGSFAVTTADMIKLADGGRFDARTPGNSVLTSAPPAAFGFLSSSPAAITVAAPAGPSAVLGVGPGQTLSVIGGPVHIVNGALLAGSTSAPVGRVNIVAAGAPGDVTLDPASSTSPVALGAGQPGAPIDITQAAGSPDVSVSAESFTVRGGDLTLTNAQIITLASGTNVGDINIGLTGAFSQNGGSTLAATFGPAPANLFINAASARVDGLGSTQISGLQTATAGAGRGGDINITSPSVTFTGGATAFAATLAAGDGGNVQVTTSNLTLDGAGQSPGSVTGLLAGTQGTAGRGAGGGVRVDASASITLTNAATINVDALGLRSAGDVVLNTNSLTLSQGGNIAASAGSSGAGGNIDVEATGNVSLATASSISASTKSTGAAGGVTIHAADLMIDGSNTSAGSAVLASTSSSGAGGTVQLGVNTLELVHGGFVAANTSGAGNAGNVHITAGNILVEGAETGTSSGIFANTTGGGNGGNVSITTSGLVVKDGNAAIGSNTFASGNAGSVSLTADSITVDRNGSASTRVTGIDSQTEAGGNAGNVQIQTGSLSVMNGALISARSLNQSTGAAGTLVIGATGPVSIAGNSAGFFSTVSTSSATFGKGAGNISLTAGSLSITDGASLSAETSGNGPAGSISITAPGISIEGRQNTSDSGIFANTDGLSGHGGDIVINSTNIRLTGSAIIAASTFGLGDGGSVSISSGDILLDRHGSSINQVVGIGALTQGSGNGGNIHIHTGTLEVFNGAEISSKAIAQATGNAGSVDVTATGDVNLIGEFTSAAPSSILAVTGPTGGQGGGITLQAADLAVADGGLISSQTFGPGRGGSVTVGVNNLALSHGGVLSSSSSGAGDAGSVNVTAAGRISLKGISGITAGSQQSAGGNVTLDAVRSISLDHSILTTSTKGAGGNISLASARGSIYLTHISGVDAEAGDLGNITLSARREVLVRTSEITAKAIGQGGQITIDPRFVVLDSSIINGQAGGRDVTVSIRAGQYLQSANSRILSTAVSVPPEVDIAAALVGLPATLLGAGAQLEPRCGLLYGGAFSSFIVTGRGAIAPEPDGWIPSLDLRPTTQPSNP